MARLALLLLAALAAGCSSAGDTDDYPIGGGGAGGGTSGPPPGGGDGGTGDGGTSGQIRGRVCLVSDLRRLTGQLPTDCATTGAGNLAVSLGGVVAADRPRRLVLDADAGGDEPGVAGDRAAADPSVVPVSASTLLPAISEAVYADLKSASGVIISPGQGSVIARVFRGTGAVTGATAQIVGGESLQTLYDGATATTWTTIATGMLGVAWLPDNALGARTLRIAYGSPQTSLSVPVAIADQGDHVRRHRAAIGSRASSSSAATQPAALCSVSASSAAGSESATMPPPTWTAQLGADDHADPDRDRELEGAARAEVAERAAVRAAPRGLELVDDLERALLRRAGDRAAGERGAQEVGVADIGARARADPRHLVVERRQLDDVAEVVDGDAAGLGDPAEVVALEVDDHQVLRGVLGGGGQLLGAAGRCAAACP